MPQTRTALRALRKARKRRLRNIKIKEDLKSNIKKFLKLIKKKEISSAQEMLPLIYKKLDMAASKKVIHENKASRKKSLLTRKLKKAKIFEKSPQ